MTVTTPEFRIARATERDVPVILTMIKGLADYEKMSDQVIDTEDVLRATLFGPRPAAEVILAYAADEPAGFALFFQNYSTFLGQPGIYLEDLFVVPRWRGHGLGKRLLAHLAALAVERAFKANAPAWTFFRAQPPGYRKVSTFWIMSAKKEETRLRRLDTLVRHSTEGKRMTWM